MKKTVLIADAGSTKTEWWNDGKTFLSQGINPVTMSEEEILGNIAEDLLQADEIHFYGAGCTPEKSQVVARILASRFPEAHISVASDLLGAARALCGREPGIACILGTGSNSCLYDGKEIVQNTPALGYILGDEGSGAVLGRLFLNALLKGRLSEAVALDFREQYDLEQADIIERTYRRPMPNRFLASISPFIGQHKDDEAVRDLIGRNFSDFFDHNIRPYDKAGQLPINLTGSIAWHYQDILKDVADRKGYSIGKILRSPMAGMVEYHFGR